MADNQTPMKGLAPLTVFVALTAATALTVWKNGGIGSIGTADTLMFFAFIALVAWLLLPRRDKAGSGEKAHQSFAVRFGQLLKRVLRPLKG